MVGEMTAEHRELPSAGCRKTLRIWPQQSCRKQESGSTAPEQWWEGALFPLPFLPFAPGALPLISTRSPLDVGLGPHLLPTSPVLLSDTCCVEQDTSLQDPHYGLLCFFIPSLPPTLVSAWSLTIYLSGIPSLLQCGTQRDAGILSLLWCVWQGKGSVTW